MKMLLTSLLLLVGIGCAPLANIEDANEAQFARIERRAVFIADQASDRLVSGGELTCEQADQIAERLGQIADELGDVGRKELSAEFLASLGIEPADVGLVLFVVEEVRFEIGLDRVELAGPRVRALLASIAEALRCD